MVLVPAASDHRHRRASKPSRQDTNPVAPSPSKVPAAKASDARAGLLGFSFSWGAHRRLRCSKDRAPVYASPTSPSPSPHPQHPQTPSPDKEENTNPLPSQADGSSSRPLRSRSLRPLRYAAAHPASLRWDLKSPSAPPSQAKRKKRGFDVALSKEEIARDFASLRCGRHPPPSRRGKKEKRKKEVQKQIDGLCPGFDLAKIDLDNYIEERGLR